MIGERIGNFKIVSQLGRGGMGEVYLGDHEKIGTKVAVKVLQPQISSHKEHVERFFNEAIAVGKIQHSGIGKIFDVGFHDGGRAYLVMEFLAGETLATRIRRLGKLPLEHVCELGRQICGVLEAVHKAGITHRDLKPDNIFIVPDEELPCGERVKIVDFGIAKLSSSGPGLTATGSGSMGTPAYMSPEQWKNSKTVDWRADAYSLGCLTFEMTAGRPPFIAETIGEACSLHLTEEPPRLGSIVAAPPPLDALVASLLAKSPDQRPATMRDIAHAFTAIVAHASPLGVTPTHLSGPAIGLGATLPSTPPVPRDLPTQATFTPLPPHATTIGAAAGSKQIAAPTKSNRGLIVGLGGIAAALAVVVVVLVMRESPKETLAVSPTLEIEDGSAKQRAGSGSSIATNAGSATPAGSAATVVTAGSAAIEATKQSTDNAGSAVIATLSRGSAGSGSARPTNNVGRQVRRLEGRPGPNIGEVGGEVGAESGSGLLAKQPDGPLPKHTPTVRDVTRRLYPRLFTCGQQHDATGVLIEWFLVVRPDGTVEGVTFVNKDLSPPLVKCLTVVFKAAKFGRSVEGTRARDSIKLR